MSKAFLLSALAALCLLAPSEASAQGVLTVNVVNGYNLIVDSNVTAPPTYAPRSAYIGADICNTGNAPLEHVFANVGNYNGGVSSTPGVFPVKSFGAGGTTPHLAGTGNYSLSLASSQSEGSRYIGTLEPGECRIQYWLFTYPACVNVAGVAQEPPCDVSITGGIGPEDDLRLDYDVWATTTTPAVLTDSERRSFTMRNEISAAANKIWPNTTAKVPDEYLAAIESVLGWGTLGPDGQPLTPGTPIYPGQREITTEGIWYDLGTVGAGFDNDGDLIPDKNAWLQPVGDFTSFNANCFRMVKVYGVVVVKLVTGGELLIPFLDQLYFEHLPDNTGVVGLVYYQFVATDQNCAANLSPYQEAASGFDNEKFSGDYGLNLGLISGSYGTSLAFTKTDGQTSVAPGGTLTYTGSATNTTGFHLGAPPLGVPLTFIETIPAGTVFVPGSAADVPATNLTEPTGLGSYTQGYTDLNGALDTCAINYTVNSSSFVVLYSNDNGATFVLTEPLGVTNIKWILITKLSLDGSYNKTGSACVAPNGTFDDGTVETSLPAGQTAGFKFQVTLAASAGAVICNTARVGFGSATSSKTARDCTLVTGVNRIAGTVFEDDGGTGGTHGNGRLDNVTEVGIGSGAIVDLYYDANADGAFDSGDLLYGTTTTSPRRSFTLSTTTASSVVTSAGLFLETDVGSRIFGPGIPTGAYISAFTTTSSVTISVAATATATVTGTLTGGAYSFNSLPDGNFVVVVKKYDGALVSAATTSGSATVTSVGLFLAGDVGRTISGPGIPIGATIIDFTSANSVTISAPATATGNISAVVDRTDGVENAVNDFLAARSTDANNTAGWGNTTLNPNRPLTTDSGILKRGEALTTATLAISIDLDHSNALDQSATTTELRQVNFAFAPPLQVTKTVPVSLVDEGDFFTYSINLKNRLPSVGVQGPTGCQYTVWATGGTNGAPKGFTNHTNAYDGPNRTVATGLIDGGGLRFLVGSGFPVGTPAGTITRVELLNMAYYDKVLTDDFLTISAILGSTTQVVLGTATIDTYIGESADLDPNSAISADFTALRPGGGAWTFADFATLQTRIDADKAGPADSKTFAIDATGIRVTTNAACVASESTTLNPVPLQDQFDTGSFRFVSAVPPPNTVSGGTLQWDNVGPITPGATTTVSVTVQALDVAGLRTGTCATVPPPLNSACNYVEGGYTGKDVYYADGRKANNASASVPVNIVGKAELRGTVWSDTNNDGWAIDAGEPGLPNVSVTLFGCFTTATGVIYSGSGNNQFCSGTRSWQVVKTTTTSGTQRSFSVSTTSGSAILNAGSFLATDVGSLISGTGIPAGARIVSVASSGVATISANATGTATVTATLTGGAYEFLGLDTGYYVIQVGDTDSLVTTVGVPPFSKAQTAEAADTQAPNTGGSNAGGAATQTTGVCAGGCNNTWGTSTAELTNTLTNLNLLSGATEEKITGINFGYFSNTASLYGNVWHDVNGDATRDPEDGDLLGFTVTLSGTSSGTTTTDANGDYSFSGLAAGSYTVTITPPTLINNVWSETVESTGGTSSLNNAIPVTLAAGDISGSHDFGYTLASTSTIGDTVYYDFDGDGFQDSNETGIENVTVRLYQDVDRDGAIDTGVDVVVGTDVTDASGKYLFTDLEAGSYVVKVDTTTLPTEVTATGDPDVNAATIGDLIWLDSDGDGVKDANEDGIPGVVVRLWAPLRTLSGTTTIASPTVASAGLFLATDVGRPISGAGIPPNTTIVAFTDSSTVTISAPATASATATLTVGEIVASTTTSVNGNYLFTGLNAGTYTVSVVSATLPNTTLALTSADPGPVTFTSNSSATTNLTKDFGFSPTTNFALGNRVWHDRDGDSVQDGGEVGLPGVTVTVTRTTAGPCNPACTTTTDESGFWLVTGLTNGSYTVAASNLPRDFLITAILPTQTIASADLMTADLGFRFKHGGTVAEIAGTPTSSITGRVFQDADGDLAYDASEEMSGTLLNLLDDANNIVASTTTAADGTYTFTGVFLGDYAVQSVDELGTRYSTVFLAAGVTFPNLNVIYNRTVETTPDSQSFVGVDGVYSDLMQDFGYRRFFGSIGDTVYWDANANATQDLGEPGFSGVTVNLYLWKDRVVDGGDGDGIVDALELTLQETQTTTADDPLTAADESGKYLFANLDAPPAGQAFMVEVVTSTIPGATKTLIADPDTDGVPCPTLSAPLSDVCDSRDVVVAPGVGAGFAAGTIYLGADFGYQISGANFGKIGDHVWIDSDGDGTFDSGELGIPRITVFIDTGAVGFAFTDLNGNGRWDSASEGDQWVETDTDGYYLFTGLADGSYNVKVLTGDADWPSLLPILPTFEVRTGNTASRNSDVNVVISGGAVISIVDGDGATADACTNCDLSSDFGYRYAGTNTLSGTVCTDDTAGIGYCGATATTYTGVASGVETSLAGIQVFLYSWTDDGDNVAWDALGALDSGDTRTLVGSTSTDANGDYSFTNVPERVLVVLSVAPSQNLRITTTQANTSVEDGLVVSHQLYDGFEDTDGDGTKDPTEVTVIARQALNLAGDADNNIVDLDFAFDSTVGGTIVKDFGDLPDLAGTGPGNTTDYDATMLASGASHRVRPSFSVATTDMSTTVTSTSFLSSDVGSPIVGPGIPAGATITAVINGVSATISSAATATAPSVTAALGWFLGDGVSTEANGQSSAMAALDTLDDGVSLLPQTGSSELRLVPGAATNCVTSAGETVCKGGIATIKASGAGWVAGWMDFNSDGDFADAGERIINQAFTNHPILGLTQNIAFDVPSSLPAGTDQVYFARFRIYPSEPLLLSATGAGLDSTFQPVQGEVEDYRFVTTVTATQATVTTFVARDIGGAVALEWVTSSEVRTVGFFLRRFDEAQGVYVAVNEKLLPSLLTPQGGTYRYIDPAAVSGTTYRYELVEVESSGKRNIEGPYYVNTAFTRDTSGAVKRTEVTELDPRSTGYAKAAHPARPRGGAKREAARSDSALDRRLTAQGAKIAVAQTGIHYVSLQDISAKAGLSIDKNWLSSNKNLYSLTNRGEQVALTAAADFSGLLFYGEQLDSVFARDNVYWIGPSDRNSPRMKARKDLTKQAPRGDETFSRVVRMEQDVMPAPGIFSDPEADYWLWDYVYSGWGSKTFSFRADGARRSGEASITIRLKGGTDTETKPDHHAVVRLNGQDIGDVYLEGTEAVDPTFTISPSLLVDGENTLEVDGLTDTGAEYSLIYIDSFDVRYESLYRARGNKFEGSTGENATIMITGFTRSDIMVFDVTDPKLPVYVQTQALRTQGGGFGVALSPTAPNTLYYAIAGDAILRPAGIERDVASTLKSTDNQGEYVVITTRPLMETAQTLANYRSDLRSQVVDIGDIYDEFNFGIPSPHAVKNFLAYARANWSTPPRYVVLAGDGTWDYKDTLGLGNPLPPMMVSTPFGLFASDVWFALGPSGAAPEIAIGRLPVTNAAELAEMIRKIQIREGAAGSPWLKQALLVADNADDVGDFPADSGKIAALMPPGSQMGMIDLTTLGAEAARTMLIDGINNGTGMINYIGHGGYGVLADEGLLWDTDVDLLVNSERTPVMTAMTCLIGNFALPWFPSIGEALVRKDAAGLAALWAPTGMSENEFAVKLAQGYYRAVSTGSDGSRIGDAIVATMKAYKRNAGPNYMLSIYTLLGDPAMRAK